MTGAADTPPPLSQVDALVEGSLKDIGIPPRPAILEHISREMLRDEPDYKRLAKVISAEAALANSRSCIQLHGGIGFTAECAAHVFLKRAHLLGQLGGERRWIRTTLLSKRTAP